MADILKEAPELLSVNSVNVDDNVSKKVGWWKDVGNNYRYTYGNPLAKLRQSIVGQADPNFVVNRDHIANAPLEILDDVLDSNSQEEVDFHMDLYKKNLQLRDELSNGRFSAMIFAGIADPINLIPLPTVKGLGFYRGFKRTAGGVFALSAGVETIRKKTDPLDTGMFESVLNVGGSALFGGLLGGGVGHITAKRFGENYHNASNFAEGRKSNVFPVSTKTVKFNNTNTDKFDGTIEVPDIKKVPEEQLFEENGFEYLPKNEKAKAQLEKDNKFVWSPMNKLSEISPVYKGISRFSKSDKTQNIFLSAFGDGGQYLNKTKLSGRKGFINDSGGTVLMNNLQWTGETAKFIKSMQKDFLALHNIDKPFEPLEVKVGFAFKDYQQQAKGLYNRLTGKEDTTMTFDDFQREVGVTLIKAEQLGKLDAEMQPNPHILNSAKSLHKFFKKFEVAGDEVGFFVRSRTFENTEARISKDIKNVLLRRKELSKIKSKKKSDFLRYNLATERLLDAIDDYEYIQLQLKKNIEKQRGASLYPVSEKYLQKIIDNSDYPKVYKRKFNEQNIEQAINDKFQGKLEFDIAELKRIDNHLHSFKKTNNPTDDQFIDSLFVDHRNLLIDMLDDLMGNSLNLKQYKTVMPKDNVFLLKTEKTKIPDSVFSKIKVKDIDVDTYMRHYKVINDRFRGELSLENINTKYYFPHNHITENYVAYRDTAVDLFKNHYLNKPIGKLKAIQQAHNRNIKVKFKNPKVLLRLTDDTRLEVERVPTLEDVELQAQFEAEKTINKLTQTSVMGDVDGVMNKGLTRHQMSRELDIPPYQLLKEYNGVADFIHANAETISRNYSTKVGPSIESARMFRGDRFAQQEKYEMLDDILVKYADEANNDTKNFLSRFNNQNDDFEISLSLLLQRQPISTDLGSPTNQASRIVMDLAHSTMMGQVIFASAADPMKVILNRGMNEVFGRYLRSWFRDIDEWTKVTKANQDLIFNAGIGIENILNNASRMKAEGINDGGVGFRRATSRFVDGAEKLASYAKDKLYVLSGLNEWTAKGKKMILPMAADRIIRVGAILNKKEKSSALNKYFDLDLQILKTYGLDEKDLKAIHNNWSKHNSKNTYKGKLGVYYDNHRFWYDKDPILTRKYLNAIRMEVTNTYMTPTQADKPLVIEGGIVRYSKLSKKLKDHQATYYKAPFQFMTWAVGAQNKILNSTLQGRHRGVFSGISSMILAGAIGVALRNPGYWQYMSTEERLYKAIEYSGITSYWLDINNMLEILSVNEYGIRPNILGVDNPFARNTGDAIAEPFGPAGGMVQNVARLFYDEELTTNEKAHMIKRLLPFNNIFYLKWLFKSATNSIVDSMKPERY